MYAVAYRDLFPNKILILIKMLAANKWLRGRFWRPSFPESCSTVGSEANGSASHSNLDYAGRVNKSRYKGDPVNKYAEPRKRISRYKKILIHCGMRKSNGMSDVIHWKKKKNMRDRGAGQCNLWASRFIEWASRNKNV